MDVYAAEVVTYNRLDGSLERGLLDIDVGILNVIGINVHFLLCFLSIYRCVYSALILETVKLYQHQPIYGESPSSVLRDPSLHPLQVFGHSKFGIRLGLDLLDLDAWRQLREGKPTNFPIDLEHTL